MERKKLYSILVFSLWFISFTNAQDKYLTKEGYISFFSHSIAEDIKADNNQALSVIDLGTHKIAIKVLMRSFMFEKALMQEHFNENYVESHKYPKATFSGKIKNLDKLGAAVLETEIVGTLALHGKEKEIVSKVRIEHNSSNEIVLKGSFHVEVADFGIKIPTVVINNIAKTIKVSFELHHKLYN